MITREQIEKDYSVQDGVIKSPGKFEGEPVYVPFYYDWSLECGDSVVMISEPDIIMFPELTGYTAIMIGESDNGFVGHKLLTQNDKADIVPLSMESIDEEDGFIDNLIEVE